MLGQLQELEDGRLRRAGARLRVQVTTVPNVPTACSLTPSSPSTSLPGAPWLQKVTPRLLNSLVQTQPQEQEQPPSTLLVDANCLSKNQKLYKNCMIPYGENCVRDGGGVKNKMDNIG